VRKKIIRQLAESAALKRKISREKAALIERIAVMVAKCLREGGCIFTMGNGGSAADAQHIAAELVGRFRRERSAFAAVALSTDTSVLTSIGNDYGFADVFRRQVEGLVKPGDIVIAISTSGDSPNILRACREARKRGAKVVGLAGRAGGKLKKAADVCLCVPSESTARIQEAHITIAHIICDLVEEELSGRG